MAAEGAATQLANGEGARTDGTLPAIATATFVHFEPLRPPGPLKTNSDLHLPKELGRASSSSSVGGALTPRRTATDPATAVPWSPQSPMGMQLYTKLTEDNACRGVPLRNMVHLFGLLLRRRPDSIPYAQRTALYERSAPCDCLDFFMSHSWRAPGFHKYLALVYFFIAQHAMVTCVCAGFVFIVVEDVLRWKLPGVGVRDDVYTWGIYQEITINVLLFSVLATFIVLFGPQMFGSVSRKMIFLDCACIHQTDEALKAKGIRSLGGYLAASKGMLLLWDETYFTRLWCVYEVACYRHLVPEGDVVVLPLRLAFLTFLLQMTYFVTFTGFMIMYPFLPGVSGVLVAVTLNAVPLYSALAFFSDVYRKDQDRMLHDLSTFDTLNAECSVQSDRKAILKGIADMYDGGISAFNQEVRQRLGSATIAKLVTQKALVPYSYTILALLPCVSWIINGEHMLWCRSVRHVFGPPPPSIICEAQLLWADAKGPAAPFTWTMLIFHLHQVFAFLPWLSAVCMAMPDTHYLRSVSSRKRAYLLVGLFGAFAIGCHTIVCYVGAGAIASGTWPIPHLSHAASAWCGPMLCFLANAPFTFGTRAYYERHQQAMVEVEDSVRSHNGMPKTRFVRQSVSSLIKPMSSAVQSVLRSGRRSKSRLQVIYSRAKQD